jgi:hypothetical protein
MPDLHENSRSCDEPIIYPSLCFNMGVQTSDHVHNTLKNVRAAVKRNVAVPIKKVQQPRYRPGVAQMVPGS